MNDDYWHCSCEQAAMVGRTGSIVNLVWALVIIKFATVQLNYIYKFRTVCAGNAYAIYLYNVVAISIHHHRTYTFQGRGYVCAIISIACASLAGHTVTGSQRSLFLSPFFSSAGYSSHSTTAAAGANVHFTLFDFVNCRLCERRVELEMVHSTVYGLREPKHLWNLKRLHLLRRGCIFSRISYATWMPWHYFSFSALLSRVCSARIVKRGEWQRCQLSTHVIKTNVFHIQIWREFSVNTAWKVLETPSIDDDDTN